MDIIDKVIAFLLTMVLAPIAIGFYINASVTGLTVSELAIWGLLMIFFLLGIAIPFIKDVRKGKK